MRYWASWWTGNYADEGCTKPPFKVFDSGRRDRPDDDERDDCSMCAWFDADSEDDIRELARKHFPDYEERFITPVETHWLPNDRFPGATCHRIERRAA